MFLFKVGVSTWADSLLHGIAEKQVCVSSAADSSLHSFVMKQHNTLNLSFNVVYLLNKKLLVFHSHKPGYLFTIFEKYHGRDVPYLVLLCK